MTSNKDKSITILTAVNLYSTNIINERLDHNKKQLNYDIQMVNSRKTENVKMALTGTFATHNTPH